MSEKATKKTSKKPVAAKLFNDIKPPSDRKISRTSKPVIIESKSVIKDPMFVEDDKNERTQSQITDTPSEEVIIKRPKNSVVIQPIDNTNVQDESKKSEEIEVGPLKSSTEISDNSLIDDGANSSKSEINKLVESVKSQEAIIAENEKDLARQKAIEELIDTKKYFVKISDTPKKKKAKLTFLVFLLLVAVAVGAYIYFQPSTDELLKYIKIR